MSAKNRFSYWARGIPILSLRRSRNERRHIIFNFFQGKSCLSLSLTKLFRCFVICLGLKKINLKSVIILGVSIENKINLYWTIPITLKKGSRRFLDLLKINYTCCNDCFIYIFCMYFSKFPRAHFYSCPIKFKYMHFCGRILCNQCLLFKGFEGCFYILVVSYVATPVWSFIWFNYLFNT